MDKLNEEREALRKKARRWLQTLYFGFVCLLVAVILVQLTAQALAEPSFASESVQCDLDIEALMSAVDRARAASCKTELAEDQAVTAFQLALDPEWSRFGAVRRACSASPDLRETLDAIQYLRYAEENTVRRESSELAHLRRRARELLERNVRHFPNLPRTR